MSDRKANKLITELLLPGETAWERWRAVGTNGYELAEMTDHGPGKFSKDATKHVLALPAVSVWVLPAWIKGEKAHLNEMAGFHLERMGVRTPGHAEAVSVESLEDRDGSHLVRITALKDHLTPLADHKIIPSECRLSAACYALPPSSLILWKELGRIVLAITCGQRLVYFSPLSSTDLDSNAIAEVNHICLQLGFQRVLKDITGIVLWTGESAAAALYKATGLPVAVSERPNPVTNGPASRLMPHDLIAARQTVATSGRRRLLALSTGFVMAACIAVFAFVIGKVSRERDALLEQVAAMTPKASKVESQKAAWVEAGPAVDPEASPMETLLRLMEPTASNQITLTEFEWTPKGVVVRGRAPEISPALKYMQEVKDTESLLAYNWEPGTPEIGENGAAFEVKGEKP
ncbi:MAG: hypothetical protein JNJ83_17910 [Verrucomicrobiaceae bacterium]|nr:hypothetical protein [Verrucomicrobiaceae bacterium]